MIDNRLSEVLGRRRMNVSELARGAGISRSAAHKLYHDRTESFDRDVLDRVCAFLGVDVGDLLVYVPADQSKAER
ncbi:MAG: helix-turn-helix transcriptional regulator [Chloroflexota bacterium]|nr:helix-turn-helix transcriptional regulator [Chloroflexota bacterium]